MSYKPNVVIYNTGKILWIPIAIYKSSCEINVQYFPFDEQNCGMQFGSWTFNAKQVTLGWYEGEPKVRYRGARALQGIFTIYKVVGNFPTSPSTCPTSSSETAIVPPVFCLFAVIRSERQK